MAKLIVNTVEALSEVFGRSLSSPPGSPKTPLRSPSGNRFNIRRSLQKRSSKMFARDKSTKDIRPFTDEMIRLETVLTSQKGRQLLIQELVRLPGNHSVKARFIGAVDSFDAAEGKDERLRMAEKIVETFLQKGSLFFVGLPDERVESITSGNTDNLFLARRDVLEDLASNTEVMTIVGEVEAVDGL